MSAPFYLPSLNLAGSPIAYDFLTSRSFFTGIMGPMGSGKSVACVAKMWCISMEMPPDSDNIRRSKWLIIRNTFAELKSTTIKTFQEVFPPENVGDISTSSSPIEFVIDQPATGGVPGWRIEFVFMALDRPADVKKLKSFECTGAWVNEAIEIPAEIIQMLTGRVGRYTAGSMFGGTEDMAGRWMGIIADTNACDETNWWYRASEQDQRPAVDPEVAAMLGMDLEWKFFKQPPAVLEVENGKDGWVVKEPGREPVVVDRKKVFQAAARHWTVNPEAENLQNLNRFAPSYYPQQLSLPTVTLSHIQRMIQAKYIIAVPGKPWVPEYDDASMCRDLMFDKNLPLVGGMDVGGGTLRPAAVFGQRGLLGDWRILSEVVCFDMGVDEMVTLMKLHLAERYPGVTLSRLWLDPAAVQRDQLYKTAIIEHLRANGFRMADTAPTNDPDMRRQALALPMTRLTRTPGGPVPAFMVDRGCKQLRQALAGKWHRRQINVRGDAKFAERPEKNEWSDVGDACSYLCLGGGEHRAFTTGRMQPQGPIHHAGPRPNLMSNVRPFG